MAKRKELGKAGRRSNHLSAKRGAVFVAMWTVACNMLAPLDPIRDSEVAGDNGLPQTGGAASQATSGGRPGQGGANGVTTNEPLGGSTARAQGGVTGDHPVGIEAPQAGSETGHEASAGASGGTAEAGAAAGAESGAGGDRLYSDAAGGVAGQLGAGTNGGERDSGGSAGDSMANDGGAGAAGASALDDECGAVISGMACLRGGVVRIGDAAVPDASPVHLVTVRPFYMDVTEVTVQAYNRCVSDSFCNPAEPPVSDDLDQRWCNSGVPGREQHPINCIGGRDAWSYCASLGKRLPTEEEWEYAARHTSGAYPWGDSVPNASFVNLNEQFMSDPDWGTDHYEQTSPVGHYPPGATPDGICDLIGNVWEWTQSRFCSYTADPCMSCTREEECAQACNQCDQEGWVLRGGSFAEPGSVSEATALISWRGVQTPETSVDFIGFRCVKDASAH